MVGFAWMNIFLYELYTFFFVLAHSTRGNTTIGGKTIDISKLGV